MYKILLTIAIASVILTGCKTTGIDINTISVEPEIPVQSRPAPLTLHKDIKWYVVTRKNFKRFLKVYEARNGSGTFYAISPNDYKKLALNISEMKRYIASQQALIVYYEKSVRKRNTNK